MARVKKFLFLGVVLFAGCRIPDYKEIKNLYQVTRYLSAARFDKEFQLRKIWAISGVNPKLSAAAKERWVTLQNAVWDFTSFHQSFYDVTLEQGETDIWEQPFVFLDSKLGKKLTRSLDLYYEQAHVLWRDFKEKDITQDRRVLITELYFLGFDLGLEEDIARLMNPLFTEAEYKVEHGHSPGAEDEDFKELSEKNLRKELKRVRKLEQSRTIGAQDFRDLAIRLSLMTDEELALIIREQSKPENIDMTRLERIAIAESMSLQVEDFLAERPPAAKTGGSKLRKKSENKQHLYQTNGEAQR
jgi:hypothetical protein